MRLLAEVQNKLSRSKHKSLFPRLFTETPNPTTKHAQTRARINKHKKCFRFCKPLVANKTESNNTQHPKPNKLNESTLGRKEKQ